MSRVKQLIISLAVLTAAQAGRAAGESGSAAAEPLRLEWVIAEARQNNPAIRGADERARAAAAVPARVSAYDDPVFSYEAWNAPDFRLNQADNNIFKLSQRVPFPGKRTLAGQVAARDADVARRQVEAVELDVVASAKAAYYGLWQVHESLLVYAREKELVQRIAHIAEQRYALGEVSQSDVLRAQVELTRLINRVTTQTLALDSARAELNALLSREPGAPLGVPEDPPAPRLDTTAEALVPLALERRPEVAAQAAEIAREETALRLARRDYLPDFEFAASRFVNSGSSDGFGAFASLTIPLAYKSKYDAGVAEANARLTSARADMRRLEDGVRRDVAQAFVRARTALLQYDLFVTTHIPQAEQALKVTEGGYRTGAVEFTTLLDTARGLELAHLDHFEAAAAFEKAYAELERAVGTTLPGDTPTDGAGTTGRRRTGGSGR